MIPDEAVEAAARKLYATLTPYSWDGLLPSRQDSWRTHVRLALEAAAPHLMAEAWDDGGRAAIANLEGDTWQERKTELSNPYRKPTNV